MDEQFFVDIARESGCQAVVIGEELRRRAINKKGHRLEREETVPRTERKDSKLHEDDEDLLFTPSSLRQALDKSVLKLLRCRCGLLCKAVWQQYSDKDDTVLAQEIGRQIIERERQWSERTLAAFVLSGTTFALRSFHDSEKSLDSYVEAIANADFADGEERSSDDFDHELRDDLFAKLLMLPRWQKENAYSLSIKLYGAIRAKDWLMNVPRFVPSHKLTKFPVGLRNMPFLEQREVHQEARGRKAFRFRLADYYASDELQVCIIFP